MSDVNTGYDELEVIDEVEDFEGGKDFSTAIGVGVIAVGGALAYEGVKQGSKLVKVGYVKLKDKVTDWRAKKKKPVEIPMNETEKDENVK